MNKKKLIILIIVSFFIYSAVMYIYVKVTVKYPAGRDTVQTFGDGTYQIMRNLDRTMSLDNVPLNMAFDDKIYRYKKIGDLIYVYGSAGYTILNFKTNEVKQYANLKGYNKYQKEDYIWAYERFNKEYGNKWIRINKFNDFTDDEKKYLKA